VAYVKLTGIILIVFDKQKIQAIIEIIQKIVGAILVNPFVDFKNPLETIPRPIPTIRNI
jgi:hypothetical protein